MGPAGPVGLDFVAVFLMGDALGVSRPALAELLPETGLSGEEIARAYRGWRFATILAELGRLTARQLDDGFIATDLADALGGLSAGHLWLAGLGSETAVLQTYLGALYRGFDVTLIEDAHAATDVEFDGCELSASQVVALVNRIVWRDHAPDVSGDLMACANVVFNADELDDLAIIALAQEETTAQ